MGTESNETVLVMVMDDFDRVDGGRMVYCESGSVSSLESEIKR